MKSVQQQDKGYQGVCLGAHESDVSKMMIRSNIEDQGLLLKVYHNNVGILYAYLYIIAPGRVVL